MSLEEFRKQYEIKNAPGQGLFIITTKEGKHPPITRRVPAINCSSIKKADRDYFDEAFAEGLPAAAMRYEERGMAVPRINPALVRESWGMREIISHDSKDFIDIEDGKTDSILVGSAHIENRGERGAISGETIHGDLFKAILKFVPSC